MFQTNAFFRFYHCPKLRKKEKCSRPYCQYNHGEKTDQCIIDYSQTNFGYDDFFTNLKPEDIDGYKPTHYSTTASASISPSNDSNLETASSSSSSASSPSPSATEKKTKDDLFNVDQTSTKKDKNNNTGESIGNKKHKSLKIKLETVEQVMTNSCDSCDGNPLPEQPQQHSLETVPSTSGSLKHLVPDAKRKCNEVDIDSLDISNKKIRIAHTPKYATNDQPTLLVIRKNINYRQKMLERYNKTYSVNRNVQSLNSRIDEKMKSSNMSAPNLHPINTVPNSSCRIQNISLVPSYTKKEAAVVAAAVIEREKKLECKINNNNGKEAKKINGYKRPDVKNDCNISNNCLLIPIFVQTCKIALNTRTKVVGKILAELIKTKGEFEDHDDLAREAQKLEQDICVKSKGFQSLYGSLATSRIRSLRSLEENSDSKKDDGKKVATIDKSNTKKNYSIIKKIPRKNYKDLTIQQLATVLQKLTIPKDLLEKYGYPVLDETTNLAIFPLEKNNLYDFKETTHVNCDRCSKFYQIPQIPEPGVCTFHAGHAYNYRVQGSFERVYSCCRMSPNSVGCQMKSYHVTKGNQFRENRTGFVRTVSSQSPPNIYALDCEMCFTELGFELCRITVTNLEGVVVYDKLVKPKTEIIDYNTQYSGLDETHFIGVTTELEDVQRDLLKMITAESFVIGHGLDSDFRVLKILHERVIDTAHLYPHKRGLPFKRALKNLAVNYLNKIIQDDEAGHDSSEDAKTALELVKLKIQDEVNKLVFS